MIENFILKDNTVDDYIPITPVKPQVGYIPKEESQQFQTFDYDFDGINNLPETTTADTYTELTTRQGFTSDVKDISVNSANSATDYIGVVKFDIPHIIDENKADFLLMDIVTNSFTTLQSADIESLAVPLYDVSDTSPKIVSLFNGLQALRIPFNKFNDTTTTPTTKIFGKYYIKISPKYIEAEVLTILKRSQVSWQQVDANSVEGRRQVVNCNNTPFANTIWGFENSLFNKQRGRLHGSVIEIWDNTTITKKQTKISAESLLGLDGGSGIASFVLTPDIVGYDSPDEVITIGDKIRVFPRESYFNSIYIEVDYQNQALDMEALIKFMKNDAARDLKTGIIEIYDNNGITIDSTGALNGTVIQAYQMSQSGSAEIRRAINL